MTGFLSFKSWLFLLTVACHCSMAFEVSAAPSFDCGEVEKNSIEELICNDVSLAELDVKLAKVYESAKQKAINEHPPTLKAEQRGWIKGRNECWKSEDRRACVEQEYIHRIATLQARYRLIPGNGPFTYTCDNDLKNEVIVSFFQTTPPTLIAERGDRTSLMYLQQSGSGSKYQGQNEIFWEHQDEATITWGYGAIEMHCKKTP